jgi:hypothetical protein
MQFALGALTVLCFVLIIALRQIWAKYIDLSNSFAATNTRLDNLFSMMQNLPPTTQNVIHLGLKDTKVAIGTEVVSELPIKPEDFLIQEEKLCEKLLRGYETRKHPDTGTYAWCILDHVGFHHYVDNKTQTEAQKALTRLLLNGDDEAIRKFLTTLAHSVCAAQ